MKKEAIVILYILIILVPLFTPKKLLGAEIVTESTSIKQRYRQNESIELLATILNNETRLLTLELFNVTIIYAKPIGGETRVAKSIIKNLGKKQIDYHEAFSVYVKIPLHDLAPDKYNISASFTCYYDPLHTRTIQVLNNTQFQLLPAIEIPPVVIFVGIIMGAIIIVYIGYGIAGRISKLTKRRR